ncbi:MAG: hypothetical protein GY809_09195 [Planctomycetes bacterium]|nr:hypothetical protein [Planctomycetota bacterium]
MTFVSVLFLLGGLGVVGPILVHLLARPRYKRLPFTMLQFLREGQSESQARRRLRDWIILLLRCLIIALIVLLFARPIWETRVPRPPSHEAWYVGLDNSLSMTYRSQGSDLLAQLKSRTKDLLRNCPDEAEFHVFLAGDNQWHRHVTKAQAMAIVHEMKPAAALAQFGEFVDTVHRQSRRLNETARLHVALGSDFARDVMMQLRGSVTRVPVDHLTVLPVDPDAGLTNVGIVSASTSSVDRQEAQIHVTLQNTGAHAATRGFQVSAGPQQPEEVTLLPGTRQVRSLMVPIPRTAQGPTHTITVALDGSDDFKADDEIRLKIGIPDQTPRRVLLVDRTTTERLFLISTAIEGLADVTPGQVWDTRAVTVDQMTSADLTWADTFVLAGMTDALAPWVDPVKRTVAQGKRLVCFMTDGPESAILSKVNQSDLWPVTDMEPASSPSQPVMQPTGNEWTHARAGDSLTQYGLDCMVLREISRVQLVPEAQCVWRLQNGDPFVAIRPVGRGVTLWVNTSVDASLSPLAKSPAAVAWAQFLLESDHGAGPAETHDPWRACEPVLQPSSFARIETVTRALFNENQPRPLVAESTLHVTTQRPLWRAVAWGLLILLLVEPFVAERMKP